MPTPYFIWYHRKGTTDVDYFDEGDFPGHPTCTDNPWLFDDIDKAKAAAAHLAGREGIVRVGLDEMLRDWAGADRAMRMPRLDRRSGLIANNDRRNVLKYEDGKLVR